MHKPIKWKMDLVHEVAMKGMDSRANEESERVELGEELDKAHEQAVRDYSYIKNLLMGAQSFLKYIGHPIKGNSVDMGSGTGVGAAIVSHFENIGTIYAVEMSTEFVKKMMPLVFKKFNARVDLIQPVIGDFNNLEVPDGNLGSIIDIDSFHHSEDLDLTFKECYRTLKMEGAIIAVDRSWNDSYSQEELDAKLDIELNDNLKRKYNVPLGESFTRGDFGEHEYTDSQWLDAYNRNGFDGTVFHMWHPPFGNSILLKLPTFKFSIWLSSILYKLGYRRFWLYGYSETRSLFVCLKRDK